jgi:NADPH-dependent 2,4-dienoyl-CoA reductase/sulfur reductase-like enzyme
MNSELVVIGAGPAGLCAAIEASQYDVRVLLIDENDRPGGQLFLQTHKFFGSRHHMAGVRGFQIGKDLLDKAEKNGIEVLLNTTVWGVFPDNRVAMSMGDDTQASIEAENILIATGAIEKSIFFKGWTKPGVMGAGAAQKLMHVNRVQPGKRVLVVGSGNVGLIVAYQLAQAGVDVAGVIEALPNISGYQVHAGKIRRLGIPILTSHTILEACGDEEVDSAVIVKLKENGQIVEDSQMKVACDVVLLAVGLRPFDELIRSTGIEITYSHGLGGFVPLHNSVLETSRKNVYVAGDITGIEEANTAMDEGRLVGIAVAEKLNRISPEDARTLTSEIQLRLANLRIGRYGEERAKAKKKLIESYIVEERV